MGYSAVPVVRVSPSRTAWSACTVFGIDVDVQKFIRVLSASSLVNEMLEAEKEAQPLEIVAVFSHSFKLPGESYKAGLDRATQAIATAAIALGLDVASGVVSPNGDHFLVTQLYAGSVASVLSGPANHAAIVVEVEHTLVDFAVYGPRAAIDVFARQFSRVVLGESLKPEKEAQPLEIVARLDGSALSLDDSYFEMENRASALLNRAVFGLNLRIARGVPSCDGTLFSAMYDVAGASATTPRVLTGPADHAVAVVVIDTAVIDYGVYGPRQDVAAFVRRYTQAMTQQQLSRDI
jgi:hypothetical protein